MSAGAVLVIIAGVLVWLGLTGQLADLRHANLPFHPYPPAGYTFNSLDPGNKDDLINIAQADQVKADFSADGQLEVSAFSTDDGSRLGDGVTGGALTRLQQALEQNRSAGVVQVDQNRINSTIVGKLPDPADSSVSWCVRERGDGTISTLDRASGRVITRRGIRFDSKFWLVRRGNRYLITDSLVQSEYTS